MPESPPKLDKFLTRRFKFECSFRALLMEMVLHQRSPNRRENAEMPNGGLVGAFLEKFSGLFGQQLVDFSVSDNGVFSFNQGDFFDSERKSIRTGRQLGMLHREVLLLWHRPLSK